MPCIRATSKAGHQVVGEAGASLAARNTGGLHQKMGSTEWEEIATPLLREETFLATEQNNHRVLQDQDQAEGK